jgi:uncharacterized protein (TIGR04255 family)
MQEERLKLERSPLQFVLVQVRFSPITAMRNYIPPFQDKLRNSGFPGFNKEQIQHVMFGLEQSTETSTRWCFTSRDKREGVVLTEDFIVYETTNYDTFGTFTERVENILGSLNEAANIGFVSQIGLRYVDVVQALDEHPHHWFICDRLQGLSAESVGSEQVNNQFLSIVKTSEGYLKLKSMEGRGPNFMPPDLEATGLEFDLILGEDDEFRILDFDHIWKGELDFAPQDIIKIMWSLHASIESTFKAVVTPEAISVWKSRGKV